MVPSFLLEQSFLILALAAVSAGVAGGFFGARAAGWDDRVERQRAQLCAANVFIADMAALMGKLMNMRKEYAAPAATEAEELRRALENASKTGGSAHAAVSVNVEIWPEWYFSSCGSSERLTALFAEELDTVQLVRHLEYNLAELNHLIRQRNAVMLDMNRVQKQRGSLPVEGLNMYLRYADMIARNVEENIFFIDRALEKVQTAARRVLPRDMVRKVAQLDLKADAQAMMPPKDFIKGIVKPAA